MLRDLPWFGSPQMTDGRVSQSRLRRMPVRLRGLGAVPGLSDPARSAAAGSCTPRPGIRDLQTRHHDEPARSSEPPSPPVAGPTSVGTHRPEAVGAVDRSIHPRPERDLRLVAARRAHDREVLPVGPLDATLVAARTTDVPHVVAAFSCSSTAGATARAALGIRGECLLRVVLLIGRGVDELDSTVDAGDRPISVGHGAPPGRVVAWYAVRRATLSTVGKAGGLAQEAGPQRPRCRCGVPVAGRTGSFVRRRIQRVRKSDIAAQRAGWRA